MVQKFSLLLLSIILIFGAVLPPGKSVAATGSYNTVAIAGIDQLRVRSGPGTSFRVIGFINKGQKFTVLGQNENWYKINSPFGEGWVVRDFLEIKTIKQESKQDNSGTKNNMGMVNGDTLNIRQAPSTTSPVIGKLTKGTSVSIYSKQNNWVEVGFSNLRGWVSSQFIDSQTTGVSTGKTQSTKNGISGTVTANSLSVHAGASLNTKLLGTVTKGLSFTILEEKNNWAKIEYKTGSFGWVAGWYLEKKQ
jgi:N-acetylmuramoyl-L-alanine amidase